MILKSTLYIFYFVFIALVASSCAANIVVAIMDFFGSAICTDFSFLKCLPRLFKNFWSMALLGNSIIGPSLLLIYLPLSLWFWKNNRSQWWKLVLVESLVAALNGVTYVAFIIWRSSSNRHDVLGSFYLAAHFAAAGFLTSVFHYYLLKFFEKIWLIRKCSPRTLILEKSK